MYCPKCRVQYREGFTDCSDCQVPLCPGEVPAQPPVSHPEPVLVFESSDRLAIALAKGSLEDAGIPFTMVDEECTAMPVAFPACRFLVDRNFESESRSRLERLDQALPNR